jgi:hypothetical protein
LDCWDFREQQSVLLGMIQVDHSNWMVDGR